VLIVGCKQIASSHPQQQHSLSSHRSPSFLFLQFSLNTMDASPLAQLRQQQIVLSPIEDISPLSQWEPPTQRQAFRQNSLPNGQLNRNYSSSFSSFSSTSTSTTSYTNASSAGGAGYFDVQCRKTSDLLSPMASLTADMSANLSLDPRYTLVRLHF
jgi:hypothetical protein